RTRSYWLRSDERTRDRVESNLREYFRDERPVTDAIELPYMCLAYLLERSWSAVTRRGPARTPGRDGSRTRRARLTRAAPGRRRRAAPDDRCGPPGFWWSGRGSAFDARCLIGRRRFDDLGASVRRGVRHGDLPRTCLFGDGDGQGQHAVAVVGADPV